MCVWSLVTGGHQCSVKSSPVSMFRSLFHLVYLCFCFMNHSEYHRYFYTNKITGDSQWDYPQEDDDNERVFHKQNLLEDRTLGLAPSKPMQRSAEDGSSREVRHDMSRESSSLSGFRSDKELVETLLHEPPPPPPPPQSSSPRPPLPTGNDPSVASNTIQPTSHEPPPPGTTPANSQSTTPCLVASYSMSDSETGDDSDQESVHSNEELSPSQSPENEDKILSESLNNDPHTLSAPPMLHPLVPDHDSLQVGGPLSESGSDGEFSNSGVEQLPVPEAKSTSEVLSPKHSKKKRKKEKAVVSTLSMKKKGVTSLVQKWQQVQKEHIPDK